MSHNGWVSRDIREQNVSTDSTQFLILVQTAGILTVRDTVQSYTLGIYTVISTILLLSILLFQDQLLASNSSINTSSVDIGLRCIQLFVVVLSGFASVCIPRRPDVYYAEKLVDGMWTVSALAKYSKLFLLHICHVNQLSLMMSSHSNRVFVKLSALRSGWSR
jgi:hypothetical protein